MLAWSWLSRATASDHRVRLVDSLLYHCKSVAGPACLLDAVALAHALSHTHTPSHARRRGGELTVYLLLTFTHQHSSSCNLASGSIRWQSPAALVVAGVRSKRANGVSLPHNAEVGRAGLRERLHVWRFTCLGLQRSRRRCARLAANTARVNL